MQSQLSLRVSHKSKTSSEFRPKQSFLILTQSNGAFQVQENLLSDAPVLDYMAKEPGLAKNHNDFLFSVPERYSFAFYEPLTS